MARVCKNCYNNSTKELGKVVEKTFKQLYAKYLRENPVEPVSYGSFFALKPFYVRHTTQKDIEMCVCKDHLHECWSVEDLVKCSRKHDIALPFADYQSFLITCILILCLVTLHIFLGTVQKLKKQYVIIYLKN